MNQAFLDKTASLTPNAKAVLCDKATEHPFSGRYGEVVRQGTYLCRRCGFALFRASSQFASGCGWPSFDDELEHAILRVPDADGVRTEICCHRCKAHLGHVFVGEYLTKNNLRHCVNALALDFVTDNEVCDTEEAIVAGGCFWGVDYLLRQCQGVVGVESGYCGGHEDNPYYDSVCSGRTGHFEAVRVLFDKHRTDYEHILRCFFEIHDPTQRMGQGPDHGSQYQSGVFCYDAHQRQVVEALIARLCERGYDVATQVKDMSVFWPAEAYHQDFYTQHGKTPYCHTRVHRFGET